MQLCKRAKTIGTFDATDSMPIKGIAIVLMLAHHMFTFPERINEEVHAISLISAFGIDGAVFVGRFGKICVSLFLILSGFGLYRTFEKKGSINILKPVKKLFIAYWKVFAIFVPIGLLFFANQGIYCEAERFCKVFDNFSWSAFVKDLVGWKSTYNKEWWFIKTYLICLICFPLWSSFVKKHTVSQNMAAVVLLTVLFDAVFPKLPEVTGLPLMDNVLYETLFCQQAGRASTIGFYLGAVMAKERTLEKLDEKLTELNLNNCIVDVLGILIIMILRTVVIGDGLDAYYCVPLIIFCTHILRKCQWCAKICCVLGKYSTTMWLSHSFFIYYYGAMQRLVFTPRYAVLILPLFVMFSLLVSVVIEKFYALIARIIPVTKTA